MATAKQLDFGLSPAIIDSLREVVRRYPAVERVAIFGSRAKGAAKPSSDIDVAVFAKLMTDSEFSALWSELDNLPILFKLDILHWDRLENSVLKSKIESEGISIYPAD
jgi:uncharacterized protein